MKVSDVDALLYMGWYWVRNRSDYRQFRHPKRPARVTIAGKANDRLAPRAVDSILKQTGLTR